MSGLDLVTAKAVISFEVYPSAILGTNFNDVRVEAILDAETTRLLGYDPWSMHANVYPTLPDGTPNDPNDYMFVRVRQGSGETTIVGMPWIRESTVTLSSNSVVSLKVVDVGPEDVTKIVNALSANGYTATDVTLS